MTGYVGCAVRFVAWALVLAVPIAGGCGSAVEGVAGEALLLRAARWQAAYCAWKSRCLGEGLDGSGCMSSLADDNLVMLSFHVRSALLEARAACVAQAQSCDDWMACERGGLALAGAMPNRNAERTRSG